MQRERLRKRNGEEAIKYPRAAGNCVRDDDGFDRRSGKKVIVIGPASLRLSKRLVASA
jgi:hypothetical protein